MYVVIVGAGQVGRHIAASVSGKHQVVIVDQDSQRVEKAHQELDVLTIHGDGANVQVLEDAGVSKADMVIASTNDDRTNIVVCGMTKILQDAFTIARVNDTDYLKSWRKGKHALGVDFMVGTNYLVARTITEIIGLPGATDVDSFVNDTVHMVEFTLLDGSPLENKTIREINQTSNFNDLNIMAIFSPDGKNEFKFPRGDTVVEPNDQILVAGKMTNIYQFANHLSPEETRSNNNEIVLFGGGDVGYQLAQFLEESNHNLRLIESDEERARYLAENLPGTLVLQQDAEDPEFLLEEHVDEADVTVAALSSDEKNLLVSLLSKQLGAGRAVSVVGNQNYVQLFEQVGVDVAINPRLITAEEIIRHTRATRAENVAILESEQAEVLEVELDEESPLVGRPIKDSVKELPRECVFGAITRDSEFILPRGDVTLQAGDHVLILVGTDQVDAVQELL